MSNGSKNWKTENNIQRLDLPSYNPDLAPIENLWSYMKLKVDENKPRTLNDLVKNIKKVWSNLSLNWLEIYQTACLIEFFNVLSPMETILCIESTFFMMNLKIKFQRIIIFFKRNIILHFIF